jgi:hypothetical protein
MKEKVNDKGAALVRRYKIEGVFDAATAWG